jgi:predicted PhzF superfamily epimerase YddE/YHI9
VNTSLKSLWLHGCDVRDEGAGHFAVALQQNRTLEELWIDNNGITHVGAVAVAAALPFNQTLKCLDLECNPLGDDGVEALAKAVPLSGSRELRMRQAKFGERGCAALVEMLKNGSRLRKLRIDSDHWRALGEGFRCNGWLLQDAPEQYLERNKAMHLRARKSVHTLLLIRKLRRTALSLFPKEVVREIAQFVYSSRGEISVWQANKQ